MNGKNQISSLYLKRYREEKKELEKIFNIVKGEKK